MKQYSDFDEFIQEGPGVNQKEREAFTRKWLRASYNIVNADELWVRLLSDVHNHDNQPLHFGQIRIGTAFSALNTQLVKENNSWHIGVAKPNATEGHIIHPLKERVADPNNEKLRRQLEGIATTGKVVLQQTALPVYDGVEYEMNPTTVGDVFVLPEKDEVKDDDAPQSAPISLDGQTKTTSVDIDLSAFLK